MQGFEALTSELLSEHALVVQQGDVYRDATYLRALLDVVRLFHRPTCTPLAYVCPLTNEVRAALHCAARPPSRLAAQWAKEPPRLPAPHHAAACAELQMWHLHLASKLGRLGSPGAHLHCARPSPACIQFITGPQDALLPLLLLLPAVLPVRRLQVMKDPVVLEASGFSFERKAIEVWHNK